MSFKVGDKVIDRWNQIGVVSRDDCDHQCYILLVTYVDQDSNTFTPDGKYIYQDEGPSLWHCTPLHEVLE